MGRRRKSKCNKGAGIKAPPVNNKVEMQDGVHILEYQSSAHNLLFFTRLAEHRDVLCDVTLVAEGTRIKAHRIVLSTCSDYFKAMFTNNMAEIRKEEIEMVNVESGALIALIDFCYSGRIRISDNNVHSILP
ncbi:BTB/POZ domain protein, partial [Cooperia oncophora]